MPKKSKSKSRLDHYYQLAKGQGYRSRACFKLIQLNKKYGFLGSARAVIDLCAAPGGWLQVAEKFCPMGTIKIGIDLDPIKPIPGCKTFQQDITTPKCFQLLKQELRHAKVDVVLNDGAPNVGANWSKDAFNQNDLVLSALKLATTFLRPGGIFVTKVFRSNDYNSLIWVMNQFFKRVEANKPLASRFTSAEIFVVCLDYIAPEFIDEKLFDSKFVFKETEADILDGQMEQEIVSIDKILEKRKRRQGYADDVPMTIYNAIDFEEFITIQNPYPVFLKHNSIKITEQHKEKFFPLCKQPKEWESLIEDIKVLGKREISILLQWRSKLILALKKIQQQEKDKLRQMVKATEEEGVDIEGEEEWEDDEIDDDEDDDGDEIEEDDEQGDEDDELSGAIEEGQSDSEEDEDGNQQQQVRKNSDEELEDQIREAQKKEMKDIRKKRERKLNIMAKQAPGTDFANNLEDEELFNYEKHKNIQQMRFIEIEDKPDIFLPKTMSFQNDDELNENIEGYFENQQLKKERGKKMKLHQEEDANFDEDHFQIEMDPENQQQVDKEKEKMEEQYIKNKISSNKWFDKEMFKDVNVKPIIQRPTSIANTILNQNPFSCKQISMKANQKRIEQEELGGVDSDGVDIDTDGDYEDVDEDENVSEGEYQNEQSEGSDEQVDSDSEDIFIDKSMLQKRKRKEILEGKMIDYNEKVPGELSDDEAYIIPQPLSDMEKRRKKMKKNTIQKIKKDGDPMEQDAGFQIVPQPKLENYDIDQLAETLALAKKMLRKRTKNQIIDATYNRYAVQDDDDLPNWFKEDEEKNIFKIMPITKEEFKQEKQRLMAINARQPRKVAEALFRQKKRMAKQIQKAKSKATSILEQEGISENAKLRQINTVYQKEIAEIKQQKKYVVGRQHASGPVNKGARGIQYVDRRSKKDTRNQRKQGIHPGNNKKSKSVKRQVSRHKGKKATNY